jgi:DNA-binding transcriptional LysR family regulator
MELVQIRTFQRVAALQSFSKAAEELHLTQPAVTSQIKNLESELGQHLIDRAGRSFSLTPAGEAFLAYAQQITNLTEQAHATLEQFSNQRGRICIGAGTTTTIFRLPAILSIYHHAYPKVEVQIRNGASNLVNSLVYENAVDLDWSPPSIPRLT